MRRAMVLIVILSAAALAGLFVLAPQAEGQPTCAEGTLTGDVCVVIGDAPVMAAYTCPVSSTVFQRGSFCYQVVPRNAVGSCPPNTIHDTNSDGCLLSVDLASVGLVCTRGFTLVDNARCERYLEPTCGPSCRGRITLTYSVECVGDGVGRVSLGTPELENGAKVSFVTVNGSATIGAHLAAGSSVVVTVTPERLTDEVTVSGPPTVPACGAVSPTQPPTAAPTAAPTTAPVPTSAPAPAPTAEAAPAAATALPPSSASATPVPATATATAAETTLQAATSSIFSLDVSDCDASGLVTVHMKSSLEPVTDNSQFEWQLDGEPLGAPTTRGERTAWVRGDGSTRLLTLITLSPTGVASITSPVVLPDCPTQAAETEAEGVPTQATATVAQPPADNGRSSLPILPLVGIAGATSVLAVVTYVGLSRKTL